MTQRSSVKLLGDKLREVVHTLKKRFIFLKVMNFQLEIWQCGSTQDKMNPTKLFTLIFDKYAIASIHKMHEKAHEILDKCEAKEEILDFETLEPDTAFDSLCDASTIQELREAATHAKISNFLDMQDAYAVHKNESISKPVTFFVVKTRLIKFQMDIINVAFINSSYKYVLTIIDMFSKYAFLVPLTHKSGQAVGDALDTLFSYPPLHLDVPETVPRLMLSDCGGEFKNSIVRAVCLRRGIGQIFSRPYHPLGIIERFNQTIKRPIKKLHVQQKFPRKKKGFAAKLQVILTQYNTSTHSSTGYPPIVVHFTKDESVLEKVHENLIAVAQKNIDRQQARAHEPLVVGDKVRVEITSDPTKTFQELRPIIEKKRLKKFATGFWTREQFLISKIKTVNESQLFLLKGHERVIFRRNQLQKVLRVR